MTDFLKSYEHIIALVAGLAIMIIGRRYDIHIPGLDEFVGQVLIDLLGGGLVTLGWLRARALSPASEPDQEPMEYGGGE